MKKFNNKENERVELNDGRVVWLSRSVAIVNHVWAIYKGEVYVLIGQRGPGCPDEIGKWNLPCGYLDWDETLLEGCAREIYEETGLDIDNISSSIEMKNDTPWLVTDSTDNAKQNVSLHYGIIFRTDNLPNLTNENSEPDEVSQLKWATLEDVENLDFAFNHKERIKQFIHRFNLLEF